MRKPTSTNRKNQKYAILFVGHDGIIYRYVARHATKCIQGTQWAWAYQSAVTKTREFNASMEGSPFFLAVKHAVDDQLLCDHDLLPFGQNMGYIKFKE